MKIKTLLHGSDGVREYEAGAVLEGDSVHVRTLLVNDLAEPLDEQAKRIHDEAMAMSDEEWDSHPLHSDAHWDRGEEARTVQAELAENDETADVVAHATKSSAPPPIHD